MAKPESRPMPQAKGEEHTSKAVNDALETLLDEVEPGAVRAAGMQTVKLTNGGTEWVAPTIQELRNALPEFDINGLVECGGMGAVYSGVQRSLERKVAIKVLRPEFTIQRLHHQRFINEARITAQLDHPNIPAVYVLESDQARFFSAFAMKMLEGRTLENVLEENECKNCDGLSAAIEVLLRISDALAFAHSKEVLHLDLKPSNVIVGCFGQIYLVDWGIAQRKGWISREPGGALEVEGTPAYMAPEQARGERWKIDERTDTFALGGILYRILCGRAPHEADSVDRALTLAANVDVTPPDVYAERMGRTLPRRLVSICMKALASEPEDRYQSVEDFQHDLERYARGLAQFPQREFKAGEVIINEGEVGDAAYVIISGECVATRQVHGDVKELRRLIAGEMFGEASIFTGEPRSATVSTVNDTVVGIIDKATLREEMERTSFMSLAIRTVTSTFLDLDRKIGQRRQQSQVIELALRHMALHAKDSRVAWRPLLTYLTEKTGATEADVTSWVLGAQGLTIEGGSLVLRG